MSRSERYISPSAEQLERWRQAAAAAKRCDEERQTLLRRALNRTKKADLVELLLRVAHEEKAVEWLLERELPLDKPIHLLVNDIGAAIKVATRVDEARINYNFEFDQRAYEAVQQGLSQLIQKGGIEESKALGLELMAKGGYQIECSDEGLMQEEIEACLRPVISAAAESPDCREWARNMLRRDRGACICRRELLELAETLDA